MNIRNNRGLVGLSCLLIVLNVLLYMWYGSEERAWNHVDKHNLKALRRYIKKGHIASQIDEATAIIVQMAEPAYEKIDYKSDSLSPRLRDFMKRYPEFDTNRIENNLYQRSPGNRIVQETYLELFPEGKYAKRIIKEATRHDQKVWQEISETKDDRVLVAFIRNTRSAEYRDKATSALNALYSDYEFVKRKNTYDAYVRFLKANPDCPFKKDVSKRMLMAGMNEKRWLSSELFKEHEQSTPSSGVLRHEGSRDCIAPLEIKTSSGLNYYVKVVSKTDNDNLFLFIRGGETLEVKVPLGQYEIRYASGTTWYGEDLLFGSGTSYSKADRILEFRRTWDGVSGYTLTLFKVQNGNLSTSPIAPEDF